MAFALNRSAAEEKSAKKNSFSSWLGRRQSAEAQGDVLQADVEAGVNRALRGPKVPQERSTADEKEERVREALGVIETALYAIDGVRDILEQACEVAISAKSVEDVGGRALLAERYDELRLSINDLIEKADPRATQLIGPNARHLDVTLEGKARYSVSSTRLDINERGLNVSPPRDAFSTFEEIDVVLEELDAALGRADRAAAGYCRDAQYLIARMKGEFED